MTGLPPLFSRLVVRFWVFAVLCGFCFAGSLSAQLRIGTGEALNLYRAHCASCHGQNLEGGLGGSLLGEKWKHLKGYDDMAAYIAKGNPQMGMPAFEVAMDARQIRSVVIFIRERNAEVAAAKADAAKPAATDGIFEGGGERFRVENVVTGLETPWAVAFFPDGKMLITEKRGTLRIADKDGTLSAPVAGTPEVWSRGQGGLLEAAPHPQYSENGWIYLGYSEKSGKTGGKDVGMTKVVRGRIEDGKWTDEEVLFEVPAKLASPAGVHFGTRFVFQDGYLFFTMGDRGQMEQAQELSRPNGKTHRIHDDGRIPADNPFINTPDAWPSVWTYGNRNAQGLAAHPVTGDIWEAEHGPRGGDEINLIGKGLNYGWPVISHGMNYDGRPITDKTHAPGMEQPKLYWIPSIAVCGIDFYEGDLFPSWKHNLFAGGLASNELHRLVIEGREVVKDEIVLKGIGRIRDVASAPDGSLMLVLNEPDKIVRLVPVRP